MNGLLLLCLLGIGGVFAPIAEPSDLPLLPPDRFLGMWLKLDAPRVFAGAELYGYIDGGAEIFLELGFERLTVQRYSGRDQVGAPAGSSPELQIQIYRMRDTIAATGIYFINCGKESPDPSFPERHTINRYQLLFKRHQYYVVVSNFQGESKLIPAMIECGRVIASHLPAEERTTVLQLLPEEDLDKSSIRLIRGPYGLGPIFTLGEGDVLQLHRSVTAVSGEYQNAGGRSTLIVVEYPEEEAAVKAFGYLRANLDSYLQVVEAGNRRLVFKDPAGKFGLVSLTGNRLSIRVHLAKL